jgi:hypothetical protein
MVSEEQSLEDRMYNIVEGIIEAEHNFLNDRSLRIIPYGDRPNLIQRFLSLNAALAEITLRTYAYSVRDRNAAAAILTYTLPNTMSNFFDTIPIVATQAQIQDSLSRRAKSVW